MSACLGKIARANAVAAGALDVGILAIADVKRFCGVDPLFGQIFREKRFALAAAMVAGGVEKIPRQPRAAGPQQAAELARTPIGVGDEADPMPGALHVGILPKHIGIDPAQLELGMEFGRGKVVQPIAVKSEQPERKIAIDIGDTNFGRSAPVLGGLARPRLGMHAMLNEVFRSIWMRFGNPGKLVGPLKNAVRSGAGS